MKFTGMNFIGKWVTRDGSKVQLLRTPTEQKDYFIGGVLEPYRSPDNLVWDAEGNCPTNPGLDLMERISEKTKK